MFPNPLDRYGLFIDSSFCKLRKRWPTSFGSHYDIYQNMHGNDNVREAARKEQLQYYVRRHNLPFRYYQDYGWPAVEL